MNGETKVDRKEFSDDWRSKEFMGENNRMDEVKMLVSGLVVKDKRRIVRVSFLRGEAYAEGILPEGRINKSNGFTNEEIRKLENFLRANKEEILGEAKKVNPIRSWMRE